MTTLAFNVKTFYDDKGVKQFGLDLKEVEGHTKKATTSTEGLESSFKKLAAGGALLAAGKELVDFGKMAINTASDVQEMESKFNVVFANVGETVTAELAKFASATGQSTNALKEMASTLGDTLKPMGFAEENAGALAVTLSQLAIDLSSFNNMPTDEALRRLQGTLVGSHENALAFGVVINEASLKEELMAMGANNLTGALLNQAKVQARINLLMAGTTDAQGDAIRTADGYANKQRALQAATNDLAAVLGDILLPAATSATDQTTELAKAATIAARAMRGDFSSATAQMADEIIQNAIVTGDYETALNKLQQTISETENVAGLFTGTNREARESLRALLVATINTSTSAKTMGDRYKEVEKSLKEVFGTSVRVEKGMVVLNGETVAYADELFRLALAQRRETEEQQRASQADELAEKIQRNLTDATSEHSSVIRGLSRENESLNDKRAQSANLLSDEVAMINTANSALESYRDRQSETAEALRQHEEAQRAVNIASGDYFSAAIQAEESTLNVNQAIFNSAASAEASAEQLAILGGALGLYSEEAVEAALQTAMIQIKIDELAQAYVKGEISATGMRNSINSFVAELNSAESATQRVIENIDKIPSEVAVHVKVTSDAFPQFPGAGAPPVPGGAATPLASGGRVTGGIPGVDSVPALLMPGELVIPTSHASDVASVAQFAARHVTNNTFSLTQNINGEGGSPTFGFNTTKAFLGGV